MTTQKPEPRILTFTKPDNKLFPIGLAFEHNGIEMRVMVIFNQSGARGYLDLSFNDFNKLKTIPREAVEAQ